MMTMDGVCLIIQFMIYTLIEMVSCGWELIRKEYLINSESIFKFNMYEWGDITCIEQADEK